MIDPPTNRADSASANAPAAQPAAPLPPAARGEFEPGLVKAFWGLCPLAAIFVIVWAFRGVGIRPTDIVRHIPQGWSTLHDFFPPDHTIVKEELNSTLNTVQMAVVGTILGALFALPLSFLAARTTSLFPGLSTVIKTLMNILRATPIIIYAIILSAIVGLGAATGALAIAVGTFVMLTKLYAESLESIATGPVEAVRAAGGNTAQVFVFGMLPQVVPMYVSTTLYAFELNLQASFILGFVGAGGIGFDLLNYMRLFQWQQVCTILIITIIVVITVDLVSYYIRRALS